MNKLIDKHINIASHVKKTAATSIPIISEESELLFFQAWRWIL